MLCCLSNEIIQYLHGWNTNSTECSKSNPDEELLSNELTRTNGDEFYRHWPENETPAAKKGRAKRRKGKKREGGSERRETEENLVQ